MSSISLFLSACPCLWYMATTVFWSWVDASDCPCFGDTANRTMFDDAMTVIVYLSLIMGRYYWFGLSRGVLSSRARWGEQREKQTVPQLETWRRLEEREGSKIKNEGEWSVCGTLEVIILSVPAQKKSTDKQTQACLIKESKRERREYQSSLPPFLSLPPNPNA